MSAAGSARLKSTGTRSPLDRRAYYYLQLIIVFLPVLLTFFYVRTFAVEVPMWDDWDFLVLHAHRLETGQLQWEDFNLQHNESLVLFPISVSLLLAKLTGCQVLAGIYLSYAFLCASLCFLFLFFRMLGLPGRWSALWFLPASLLFLGWRQADSLLWHMHLQNTMTLFFILAALYGCTQIYRRPVFFPAAVLCTCIASFSMASGLITWVLGALYFALSGPQSVPRERRIRYILAWLALAALCIGCFIFDSTHHAVPWPTGMSFVLANRMAAVKYALTYLGGPLGGSADEALYMGSAFVLIALPVATFALLARRKTPGIIPSFLVVALVAGAIAPLLAGRLGLGVPQAFASRYVTLSSLAPIGTYFCLLALMQHFKACRYMAGAMVALLALGIFNSYSTGLRDGRAERAKRIECAQAIKDFRHRPASQFSCAYPDPGVVLQRAPWLEAKRLSLFRE